LAEPERPAAPTSSRRPLVAAGASVALIGGVLVAALAGRGAGPAAPVAAAPEITTTTFAPLTTVPTTVATTVTAAPTSTTPPTTRAAPRPTLSATAVRQAAARRIYKGLGTWADVYDWTAAFTNGRPQFGVGDVDAMAADGVQTLYIQAAQADKPDPVLEPQRLAPIIARAHRHGLKVVGWYLPNLQDVGADLAHLEAVSRSGVDSVAVDIESRAVSDVAARNARLLALTSGLRAALPGRVLGAIVLPPTLTEVINPSYWPGFPWRAIAASYDVWLPMAYWSFRATSSPYRDPSRYTTDSVVRLRNDLGLPSPLVHAIGGIADQVSVADAARFATAARAAGCVGASLYDWRTTSAALWPTLRTVRAS
jgi:hypothetical protein